MKKINEIMGAMVSENFIPQTSLEEIETYVLTPEEEYQVFKNEVNRIKNHKSWKWAQTGMISSEEILFRLSKIDWEVEIDKKELFQKANSRKNYSTWEKKQRILDKEKEEAAEQEVKNIWNAKRVFNLMGWTSKNIYKKDFIYHEDNAHMVKTVCFFISGDSRFETELGYSFKKGLLFRGVSGVGKTFNIKCVKENQVNPVLILSMIEVTDELSMKGEYNINMGGKKIIYLDDVGTEETPVNYFGTKINFFKNFIETVYLRNVSYNKLMVSTNNTFGQIEEKYGFRVRSRIREMFNIVDVTGKDMRSED